MIALGLDPSLTGFGWCVHDSSATGPARVVARGRFATSSKAIFVQRYIELRESVGGVLDQHPAISAVGVESPPFGEQYSEGLYALFMMVNEAIYVRRKDVVYFDPGSLKMLVKEDPDVRKGKMFKTDMVDAAKADTGTTGKFNHNEATPITLVDLRLGSSSLFEVPCRKPTLPLPSIAHLRGFTRSCGVRKRARQSAWARPSKKVKGSFASRRFHECCQNQQEI